MLAFLRRLFGLRSTSRSTPATPAGHGMRMAPPSMDDVVRYLQADQKISAIKLYRDLTGVGLKEAKDAVEALEAQLSRGEHVDVSALGDARQTAIAEPGSLRDVEREVRAGRNIEATKRYREITGASLKDAKDAVEAMIARLGL